VTVEVERLMKLRLVVARVGEMDLARWWNTQGQLGSLGASVLRRGFRRTHHFAQARSVFAVAAGRCREVYDAPGAVTLWHLPSAIQEEFDQRWEGWLDDAESWTPFFTEVESCGSNLLKELTRLNLIEERHIDGLGKLRRTAEQRAVQLPGHFGATADDITMLALAFSRSEEANLAVPYQLWMGDR
jgi:hypothetical protein